MPKDYARISRGKHQYIRIHSAVRNDDDWVFGIWGSVGRSYDITLESPDNADANGGGVSCTCMDFLTRGQTCKHIYHIISRVAQFDTCHPVMSEVAEGSFSREHWEELDKCLRTRLGGRIDGVDVATEVEGSSGRESCTECIICFEPFNDKTFVCGGCDNKFHTVCANEWKKRASDPTCPLCRTSWIEDTNEANVLEQLTNLKLD